MHALERFLFFIEDGEQAVELERLEGLLQPGIDIAQGEPAARRVEFFVHVDNFANEGAGQALHIPEIEDQEPAVPLLDQVKQLIAEGIDGFVVQQVAATQPGYGDGADLFQFHHREMGMQCHGRTLLPSRLNSFQTSAWYVSYVDGSKTGGAINGPTIKYLNNAFQLFNDAHPTGQHYWSINVPGVVKSGNYDYVTGANIDSA